MMGRKLAYTVYLEDPTRGNDQVAFGPESDEIPDWAAKLIGPHAYEDYDPANPDAVHVDDEHAPPPRSGKGSGKGAWQDYLEDETVAPRVAEAGIEFSDNPSAAEIIEKLEAVGIIPKADEK